MVDLRVNDRVFSKSWEEAGQFFIARIIDSSRIVILNDSIRAIVKASDLTLIRKRK